ncbi:hypothetical protein [Jonesia quinghaiensis]|uniref:hypothetical protein n=1 Tax=Jonesia quinghaiensis TaxID=262806 RepID=UPI00040298CF|nr:hypothetical protein [Jonesia quinghaiensis]
MTDPRKTAKNSSSADARRAAGREARPVSRPDWEPVGARRQRSARRIALVLVFALIASAMVPALAGLFS